MKIAVLGATGWIGSHIVNEATQRGHQVVALVRDTSKVKRTDIEVRKVDLLSTANELANAIAGVDAVIASIGGRALGNHDIVKTTAERLMNTLPQVSVNRMLWVGGAGSLEVEPGIRLISTAQFPNEYKAEAIAQSEALEVFKQNTTTVDWTFVSPAAEIIPGEKLSRYRVGADQLLVDDNGDSKISVSDYAIAMIDELESNNHPCQRIGVAY
ncbi:NADH-flavin reductase, putative [Shewanella piezotolerans WP3]|uniref:NADH-flavin reductase, putative n=1 Tax=Shewanella piezotolerans (strain WP3 / JCM 13877) TaxID=225849 RepID=B8CP53_SHEPW|nr:NAD(P)-dependent oxidoreductase [Shewanella piezotolerans]ACJ29297.1 NADH-flavin reductase, putative [Shewanella piezotolerans WP3]